MAYLCLRSEIEQIIRHCALIRSVFQIAEHMDQRALVLK